MDPLDRFIQISDDLETKTKYARQNRYSLLLIHSLIGIGVGMCFSYQGLPTSFEVLPFNDLVTILFSWAPFLGGFFLLFGLLFGRIALAEGLGMTLLLIWDTWMLAGFIWCVKLGVVLNPYVIPVYAGLTCFMLIHLHTFYQILGRNDG